MKMFLYRVAALACCLAVLAGCGNEGFNTQEENEEGGKNVVSSLALSAEGYADTDTRTTVLDNSVQWRNGDAVILGRGNNIDGCEFTVFVDEDKAYISGEGLMNYGFEPGGFLAGIYGVDYKPEDFKSTSVVALNLTIPASYNCTIDGEGRQVIDLPMAAYENNCVSELRFRHLTAAVKVQLWNATSGKLYVDKVVVTSDKYILNQEEQYFELDKSDFAYTPTTVPTVIGGEPELIPQQVVTVNFLPDPLEIAPGDDSRSVQVPILPIGEDNLTIEVYCHSAAVPYTTPGTDIVYKFSHKASAPALARNKMLTAKVKIDPASENVSASVFSVSATKAVLFSKGNLKAHCTQFNINELGYQDNWISWVFTILGSQYETVEDDERIPDVYGGIEDMSLFSYGCTGNNNGQQYWKPQATYAENGQIYIVVEGVTRWCWYQGDLTGSADWGYNAITNAGNKVNSGWRTLTIAEWEYLLRSRANAGSKKGLATVNSVHGLILLPDYFVLPDGCAWNGGSTSYSGNVYSVEQWALMESAGAVFLPAAGVRRRLPSPETGQVSNRLQDKGSQGMYWSSTEHGQDGGNALFFYEDGLGAEITTATTEKRLGHNVRLVRDVN